MEKLFLNATKVILPVVLTVVLSGGLFAQTGNTPKPTPAKLQPTPSVKKGAQNPLTAEQVAETSIFIYSGGRGPLDQIRKTTFERGRTTTPAADGKNDQTNYQRFVIRGENLVKEKIRLDHEISSTRFSLVYSDEKTFGIFNNTTFAPRDDARRAFENQIFHGLDVFLRYKTNESKLELASHEKLMGVDYYVVDITDKQDRKTRFYVSSKSYRVMMLSYEDAGVKYCRKFYDYNYAQGTLVPFRSVLWADDKIVEETEVGTITYGQKVDEELFKAS